MDAPPAVPARLEELERAILHHREEKSLVPYCTCWLSETQKLDSQLYASLDSSAPPERRVALLEEAIRLNRDGKRDVPDCPCWANAPQLVDADLYKVLDGPASARI